MDGEVMAGQPALGARRKITKLPPKPAANPHRESALSAETWPNTSPFPQI